jgi:hypothetical protein
MSSYLLPPHVHFCQRNDAFVFIDLKQDDYTLVNGAAATALKMLTLQQDRNLIPSDRDINDGLQELVHGGLLTTDRNIGRKIEPTHTNVAIDFLVDRASIPDISVHTSQLLNLILSFSTAKLRLRWQRIEDTVNSVATRKTRHAVNHPFDNERARQLTAVFLKLRSFFPTNYLCLFDSLALIEFLSKYRIYPDWVFGVRLEPWAAHCWVQHGHFTLNEDPEEAANYTPIMVI